MVRLVPSLSAPGLMFFFKVPQLWKFVTLWKLSKKSQKYKHMVFEKRSLSPLSPKEKHRQGKQKNNTKSDLNIQYLVCVLGACLAHVTGKH